MTALLRVNLWDIAQQAMKVSASKLFPILMKHNVVRCPDSRSTAASSIKKRALKTSVPMVYGQHTDASQKTLRRGGMAMRIEVRHGREELDNLIALIDSGHIRPDLDMTIQEIQKDLLNTVIENPKTPFELCAWLKMINGRDAGALGLRKNLSVQQLECSNQLFHKLKMPFEAFSCDLKGIRARRQLVLDCVNKFLPDLLEKLVADDGTPLKVTNENFHCTNSWGTGADDDLLSSQITATDYASGGAPQHDTLPPVYPDGVDGKKTEETIFCNKYTTDQKANGIDLVATWLYQCTVTFRVEFIDHNNVLFDNSKTALDRMLTKNGFILHFVILVEIRIWIHKTSKSVAVIHPPLGYAADSRKDIKIPKSARRFQVIEMLHLIQIAFRTRKELFSMDDISKDKDAIFASYVFEAVIHCFHQDKKAACAIVRDVLTKDSINACSKNNLAKTSKDEGVFVQSRNVILGRSSKVKKRDYTKLAEAENRCTWQGFDTKNAGLPMGNVDTNASGQKLYQDVTKICRGNNNIQEKSVKANVRNFMKKNLIQGSEIQLSLQNAHVSNRANRGNSLEHPHRDLEENKRIGDGLCLTNEFFWLRYATVPKGPDKKPVPHKLPDFGSIDTRQHCGQGNLFVEQQFVEKFIDVYLVTGIDSKHKRYKLTKFRKTFTNAQGQVLKTGGLKAEKPKKIDAPKYLQYILCKLERK